MVCPIWLLIFSFFFQFLNEPGAGINSSIGWDSNPRPSNRTFAPRCEKLFTFRKVFPMPQTGLRWKLDIRTLEPDPEGQRDREHLADLWDGSAFSVDRSCSLTDKQTFHGNHDKHFLLLLLTHVYFDEFQLLPEQTNKEIRSFKFVIVLLLSLVLLSYQVPCFLLVCVCVCLLRGMFLSANVKVFSIYSSFCLSGFLPHCCMYSLQHTAKNIFTTESRK